MSEELTDKRSAFLVANSGVEQVELTTPWQALRDAGAETVLVAPEKSSVQAFHNDVEKADTFDPDLAVGGKTLTSWPSLHTDVVNAGGSW